MTNKKEQEKKPYRYASNTHKTNKFELWVEYLKAPHFVKLILITVYYVLIVFPLELIKDIVSPFIIPWNLIKTPTSFIFWILAILSPFMMIYLLFKMLMRIIGH